MTQTQPNQSQVKIAAFDFDGTSIEGNSPVMLVWYLWRQGLLKKRVIFKIMLWAAAYKLHLPQSEAWVRGLVFTAFDGKPKSEVDRYLMNFYDEEIEAKHLFRPCAQKAMSELQEHDIRVIIVSATFEPIVRRACEIHPIDIHLCTSMQHDTCGCYTTSVLGQCVEGQEKVDAITAFANKEFGQGAWEITYAFGDHHSDIPLLEASRNPIAVNPDSSLTRVAKRNGWKMVDWSLEK